MKSKRRLGRILHSQDAGPKQGQSCIRRTQGQSLVEMAITMPLLILMFAGLIEVGAALRNYLVVVNANREGARMAARGRWLDSAEEMQFIAERVVAAAGIEQRGGQYITFLRTEDIDGLPANTTIAIHFVEVPDQVNELGMSEYEAPIVHAPEYAGHLATSNLDVAAFAQQAALDNLAFNQLYYANGTGILDVANADDFVIIELWYEHEQLLKLPIFTEIMPETFTLYAQTRMRVTMDSRVQ